MEGTRRLRELLDAAPANVHGGSCGWRPLHVAASYGQVDCVRELIAAGAAVNAVTATYAETALHKAAKGGHVDVIKELLAARADATILSASTNRTARAELAAKRDPVRVHRESADFDRGPLHARHPLPFIRRRCCGPGEGIPHTVSMGEDEVEEEGEEVAAWSLTA